MLYAAIVTLESLPSVALPFTIATILYRHMMLPEALNPKDLNYNDFIIR